MTALAALGLPWSLTILHIHCSGFKAFRPSRPNPSLAKLNGIIRKHDHEQQKNNDKYKYKYKDNDKYI